VRRVNELPDDRESRSGDGHGNEDDCLDDRFVADPGRDDRDDQTEEDNDTRVEDDPEDVVPEGSGRRERRKVDEVWIAEQADIVVKTDPLLEDAVPAAVEAEQHRIDRGVEKKDHEKDPGGEEKKDRGEVVRLFRAARTAHGCKSPGRGDRLRYRRSDSHLTPVVSGADGPFARPLLRIRFDRSSFTLSTSLVYYFLCCLCVLL